MKHENQWKIIPKYSITLNIGQCHYPEDVHSVIQKELGFPESYGRNWSAFWDFLDDFCGDRTQPTELQIIGLDELSQEMQGYTKKMVEILERAAQRYPFISVKVK